jgi:hypothetical protein
MNYTVTLKAIGWATFPNEKKQITLLVEDAKNKPDANRKALQLANEMRLRSEVLRTIRHVK